jgi:diphthamide biosynthesis protein 7
VEKSNIFSTCRYSPFYCHTRSAVLDLHFSPHQPEFLAVATADGNVDIWKLDLRTSKFLVHWQHVPVLDSSQLTLSLAWHPSPKKPTTLAVSFSSGTVAIIDYKHTPTIIKTLAAHSLEAWTVAWAPGDSTPNPDNFYLHSGGDDSVLSSFSADELEYHPAEDEDDPELEVEIEALKPNCDRKNHSAGVTAILPLDPHKVHETQILLTGSYDEHVRVLVRKDPKISWRSVAEARIKGGGVWRLKLLAIGAHLTNAGEVSESYTVLASCMHAGPRILEVRISQAGEFYIHILAEFLEHESMNYASDATMRGEGSENDRQVIHIASTSFYDRKLCIWKHEVDNAQSQSIQIGPV